MTVAATGALLGLTAGAGLILALGWWSRARRMGVLERIGPWVGAGDAARQSGRPWPVAVVATLRQRVGRSAAACAVGGALGGGALGVIAGSVMVTMLLVLVGALAGVLAAGAVEARRHASRSRRIDAALPDAVMLVALAVGAGETTLAALDRVAREVPGDLSAELGEVVTAVHGGATMATALRRAADGAPTEALRRFESTLALAMERGTPLASMLADQADDARAARGRSLMESAGRRDVAMLVPVVFVILPVVVVIALYPAISSLSLLAP